MPNGQTGTSGKATAGFVLSLLAGLWMLSMGGMMDRMGFEGMMRGHGSRYRSYGMNSWMWNSGIHAFGMSWPWLGFLSGIAVVIGAVMLLVRPQERRGWGLAILIISAVDFLVGMGGLLAGTLGVLGGALAMAGKR
jgi:hypothetical protein